MPPPPPARRDDPRHETGSPGSTEDLLALAMQNGAIGMYLADPADGRFLVVNPALEEFLGRSADDLRNFLHAAFPEAPTGAPLAAALP